MDSTLEIHRQYIWNTPSTPETHRYRQFKCNAKTQTVTLKKNKNNSDDRDLLILDVWNVSCLYRMLFSFPN